MTIRYQRARNVLWMADHLREVHPILNLPVRRQALKIVLDAEGVIVTRAAMRRRAFVDGGNGSYVITVRNDLDGVVLTKVLLHEYAHIHLHLTGEMGEITRQLFPCRPGDVREDEADLLAAVLWFGEDVTPDYGPIAKLVAKVDAPRLVIPVAEPEQLQLGVPRGVPMYKGPALPAGDHGSFNTVEGERRRPADRYKGPRIKVGDSHDSLLFDWSKDGKPLGFFAGNRGWCDIWDTMPPLYPDQPREIVVVGDRRAQTRDFIFSTTERYRYEFAQRERRGRSPKELLAQIEKSDRLVVATPIHERLLFRANKANNGAEERSGSEE